MPDVATTTEKLVRIIVTGEGVHIAAAMSLKNISNDVVVRAS